MSQLYTEEIFRAIDETEINGRLIRYNDDNVRSKKE